MLPSPAELLHYFKDTLAKTPLAAGGPTLDDAHLQVVMQALLHKCQLVPRAEFDAQTAVLLATRARLEQLERRVAQLEAAQPLA